MDLIWSILLESIKVPALFRGYVLSNYQMFYNHCLQFQCSIKHDKRCTYNMRFRNFCRQHYDHDSLFITT